MSDFFEIDFETYSEADLNSFGAYRYAADESTEILIMSISKNGNKPVSWSCIDPTSSLLDYGEGQAVNLLQEAIETEAPIYAHNAQFEAAICKYLLFKTFGIQPPKLTQWRCTAAMARRAAIPSSLEGCGEFLEIKKAKDSAGSRLIKQFSCPRKPTRNDPRTRIFPTDAPEDFGRFIDYCERDVEAEGEIKNRLKAFELKCAILESFQFDLAMNDRGVPVNVPALIKVNALINEYTERLTRQFMEVTGLTPGQRSKCLEWFRERGYPFEDLQAAQVDTMLENGRNGWELRFVEYERALEAEAWFDAQGRPAGKERKAWMKTNARRLPERLMAPKMQPVEMTEEAFKMLEVRSKVSYAAVKKVPTMLGAACPDGYVRGSLLWAGAERSHRWAGRIIQPQNFRRPTIKGTELAYKMICEGADIDTIEMLFGDFLEVVASMIRHFIHWPGGNLNQGDFSSVEARGAAWLCGCKRKLQMFERDEPIYETQAANIFGVSVSTVIAAHEAGDSEMRFIGKQAELGCTYNMGRPKFRGTCEGFKYQPSQKMVEEFKPRYFKILNRAKILCSSPTPFEKREIKFPSINCAQFRNLTRGGKFAGRGFTIWAYRKDGTKRAVVDIDNPTPAEWLDLCYDDLSDRAVTAWRNDNPEIVSAWKTLDTAAKDAIRNPGTIFKATDKISFGVTNAPGFRALVLKLPSGHTLIYPRAKLAWKGEPGEPVDWNDDYNTEIQFWGKIPMKGVWGWCSTYGGKLLENATQAICGDFMANGAVVAARNGYETFMLVHDELIGPQHPGQDHKTLCRHLCTLPAWAQGMPLAADGNTIPFYKKT